MENQVIFRDDQEIQAADLNNIQEFTKVTLDDMVNDALCSGRKYTGLAVTATSATSINIGTGRLWFDGGVYYQKQTGGYDLNLFSLRPLTTKKIINLVVSPQTTETNTEARDFLINADTFETEPNAVAMRRSRIVLLSPQAGQESPAPQPPGAPSSAIVFCSILMSNTGIEKITMASDTALDSIEGLAGRVAELEIFRSNAGQQINTLASDLSGLAIQLRQQASQSVIIRLMEDVARIKEKVNLPDTYIDYGSDRFLDLSKSEPTALTYNAKVEEGLRFPDAASVTNPVGLLNPSDTRLKVDGSGLVLPKYIEARVQVIANNAGTLPLNQFSLETNTLVRATHGPTRQRVGSSFVVSTASAWWGTVNYGDVGRGIITRAGETADYVVLDVTTDVNGVLQYRLAQRFTDTWTTPYWYRDPTTETIVGATWCQTFLNSQYQWITALGIHFAQIGPTGSVTLVLYETTNGMPDTNKVLATSTLSQTDLNNAAQVVGGGAAKFVIKPTLLQPGKQYGVGIITGGAHTVVYTTPDSYSNGTLFYRTSGVNAWQSDPSHMLLLSLWTAEFTQARTTVELTALQLAGGISDIDLIYRGTTDGGCQLIWEVQLGSSWYPLDTSTTLNLSSLPPLLPLRVTFQGTADVQPAFMIGASQTSIKVSRTSTTMKHISTLRTLPANTSTVRLKAVLQSYVEATHDCALRLILPSGSEIAASATTDRILDNGSIERTAVFSLGTPANSYRRVVTGALTTGLNPFVVSDILDVAA